MSETNGEIDIYASIWQEIETQNIDKGTWAKAFSLSEGNKEKSEALYISLRKEQLQAANKIAHRKREGVEPSDERAAEHSVKVDSGEVSTSVNNLDRKGKTLLMYAASHGDLTEIERLLAMGASPDILSAETQRKASDYAYIARGSTKTNVQNENLEKIGNMLKGLENNSHLNDNCSACGIEAGASGLINGRCNDCTGSESPISDKLPESEKSSSVTTINKKGTISQYYNAIIGEKNHIYYQTKFAQFDKKGGGVTASWNWFALLFTGVWALYRKMYGWFFLFWALATVSGILDKFGHLELSVVVLGVPSILFAVFSNSLYHRKSVKKIVKARSDIDDEGKLIEYLKYKGGVNTWVIWVFGIMPVFGIFAAIIIPQFA